MRPDRDVERAGHGGGREARERRLALVRHDAHPVVRCRDRALDVRDLHRALQLDRHRLAVAAHRADAHADAVDRHGRRGEAEDLVSLRARLELLAAVAVAEVAVDPRQQAAGERKAEPLRPACRSRAPRSRGGRCRGSRSRDRREARPPTGAGGPSARAARASRARPRPTPPGRSSSSSTRPAPRGTGRRMPSASGSRCSCRRSSRGRPPSARRRSRAGSPDRG